MADRSSREKLVASQFHRFKVPFLILSIPNFVNELPMIQCSINFSFLRLSPYVRPYVMQTVFWKWPGKVCVFAKKVGLEEASRSLVRHRLFVHFLLLLVHMYRLER